MMHSCKTRLGLAVCCALVFAISLTPASNAQAQGTETLFKAKCAMCHGADASGNTTMGKKFNISDLRAPEVQKKTTAELGNVITKGKNKMPAFEGKLTIEQVSELATYIRQLKK